MFASSLRRDDPQPAHAVERALTGGEGISATIHAEEGLVLITGHRLFVATRARLTLDIPFQGLRRVELDLERDQPTTLVIVPQQPRDEAQVLSIPAAEICGAVRGVALIGEHLARLG